MENLLMLLPGSHLSAQQLLSPIMYSMEDSQHPLSPRLSVADLSEPEPFDQFCLSVLVMPSSQPVVCPPRISY